MPVKPLQCFSWRGVKGYMETLSNINLVFGQKLRQARKEANITQEELAFKAGFDRTYISLLERGQRSPSLTNVFRLCSVLNITPGSLLDSVYRGFLMLEKRIQAVDDE